ncbi:MAG: hypothetical protein WCP82_12050, partial [Alphaproteobacteria bacterium]
MGDVYFGRDREAVEALKNAQTFADLGRASGYSDADIAHFYLKRIGDEKAAAKMFDQDIQGAPVSPLRMAKFDDMTAYEYPDGSWGDHPNPENRDAGWENAEQVYDSMRLAGVTDPAELASRMEFIPRARTLNQGTDQPVFYSALTKGIEDVKQAKAPADQWLGILNGLKGVKPDEIEWSGVKDWLAEQKGPVTREALLDYLRSQEVQVQEVWHGAGNVEAGNELERLRTTLRGRGYEIEVNPENPDQVAFVDRNAPPDEQDFLWSGELPEDLRETANRIEELQFELNQGDPTVRLERLRTDLSELGYEAEIIDGEAHYSGPGGRIINSIQEIPAGDARDFAQDIEDLLLERDNGAPIGTRYSQYQLPGGKNYRELLLTLPPVESAELLALRAKRDALKKPAKDAEQAWYDAIGTFGDQSQEQMTAWRKQQDALIALGNAERDVSLAERALQDRTYTSGHWKDKNILAHVRMNDRVGPNGEHLLHIEEIQSDWHQRGRKKGYKGVASFIPTEDTIKKVFVNHGGTYPWRLVRSSDGVDLRGREYRTEEEALGA